MKIARVVALMIALLSANASLAGWGQAVWVHPSKNQEDFKRDYKMCEDRAAANAANWGMAGNVFSMASDLNKCLQGEGWQKVNKTAYDKQQKAPVWLLRFDTALVGVIRAPRGGDAPTKIEVDSPVYEDELVSLSAMIDTPNLAAKIRNKSLSTAKVLWDEASLVNFDGTSLRIIRAGTDFNDRQKPQLPSVVAAESELTIPFVPADWVVYIEQAKKWRAQVLVPKEQIIDQAGVRLAPGVTPEQMKEGASARNVGKEYRLLLPIELAGKTVDYTLILRITSVDAYSVTVADFEKLLFPYTRSSL